MQGGLGLFLERSPHPTETTSAPETGVGSWREMQAQKDWSPRPAPGGLSFLKCKTRTQSQFLSGWLEDEGRCPFSLTQAPAGVTTSPGSCAARGSLRMESRRHALWAGQVVLGKTERLDRSSTLPFQGCALSKMLMEPPCRDHVRTAMTLHAGCARGAGPALLPGYGLMHGNKANTPCAPPPHSHTKLPLTEAPPTNWRALCYVCPLHSLL